ncbi:hypothetical protein E1265_35290 [Streptomyces sp. 8K308]|uniref:hypothetical protein n=1 Tax=Streptomyces sp. 8K308 TaxID=2530388 RepID=UPI001044B41A|nr:hypothetical protein [Streptomyces sp. 8K308]TDC05691.1 hypothetical protein E1265_35290 [Streptomyces sp. 8K308]
MGTIMPHITTLPEPVALPALSTGNDNCTWAQTDSEHCPDHGKGPGAPWTTAGPICCGISMASSGGAWRCTACGLTWGYAADIALLAAAVDSLLDDEIRRIQREEDERGFERDETDTALAPTGPALEDKPPLPNRPPNPGRHDRAPSDEPPYRQHPHVVGTVDVAGLPLGDTRPPMPLMGDVPCQTCIIEGRPNVLKRSGTCCPVCGN